MEKSEKTVAIYSNILNVRTTATELILEFGTFFPVTPGEKPNFEQIEPDARIVMNISALQLLSDSLQKAAQAHKGASPQKDVSPAAKAQ